MQFVAVLKTAEKQKTASYEKQKMHKYIRMKYLSKLWNVNNVPPTLLILFWWSILTLDSYISGFAALCASFRSQYFTSRPCMQSNYSALFALNLFTTKGFDLEFTDQTTSCCKKNQSPKRFFRKKTKKVQTCKNFEEEKKVGAGVLLFKFAGSRVLARLRIATLLLRKKRVINRPQHQ